MASLVDPRIEKLAKLCVQYSTAVQPKEKVLIQGTDLAFPLINEIYKECLLYDAYPEIIPRLDVDYTFFKHAKEHQLQFVHPLYKFVVKNIDVRIGIYCDPNPKRLTNIDPVKMKLRAASQRELSELLHKREAEGKLRWTVFPYPAIAQAQEAAMALEEYENFVYGSCLLDKENPIAEWEKIHLKQEVICEFLNQVSELRIEGEDTDLSFKVQDRKWINGDGKENMPDGEIFTAPIENSANGTIRFTFPGIVAGREVEDITLTFKDGKVVKASAAKGNDLLQQLLEVDGADRIGEAAIGTNFGITQFTKNMLFDEKIGGTIHIALGNSYPESGGQNKSAIHWDILKDMKKEGEIYADGNLFYKNGEFLL
ncbi:MAG: aminopeptidase [Candidatus Heimdallarchaeota archaeon]